MPLQSESQLAFVKNMSPPSSVKPGDGSEFQNICSLLADYTPLYPRKQNSSEVTQRSSDNGLKVHYC
jgi:hypothetical protein